MVNVQRQRTYKHKIVDLYSTKLVCQKILCYLKKCDVQPVVKFHFVNNLTLAQAYTFMLMANCMCIYVFKFSRDMKVQPFTQILSYLG